jgi:hypothetical protein
MNDSDLNEEQLKKDFLRTGSSFFSHNGGKNTPNILIQLGERLATLESSARQTAEAVAKLDTSVREASDSSGKLTKVLNRLTFAYLIVTGLGVLVALGGLIFQIFHAK